MRYSFTPALPKSIISHLTKIWIFYILLSVAVIYVYGIYLNIQVKILDTTRQTTESNIDSQDSDIDNTNKNIARLQYELDLNKTNQNYNEELRNAILKLFALIPDQITITNMQLEEKRLVLKGITPTQQIYSFYLGTPLKSIFSKSNVDYFPLSNGWFNFTSISTIEDSIEAKP